MIYKRIELSENGKPCEIIYNSEDTLESILDALSDAVENYENCVRGLETGASFIENNRKTRPVTQEDVDRADFIMKEKQKKLQDFLNDNPDQLVTLLRSQNDSGLLISFQGNE